MSKDSKSKPASEGDLSRDNDRRRLVDWLVGDGEAIDEIEPLVERVANAAPGAIDALFHVLDREPICELVAEALRDGWAPTADDPFFSEHVRECEACAELLAAIEEVARDPALPGPGPSLEHWSRVVQDEGAWRWIDSSTGEAMGDVGPDSRTWLGPWQILPVSASEIPVHFSTSRAPLVLEIQLEDVAQIQVWLQASHNATHGRDELLVRIERSPVSATETATVPLWVGLGDAHRYDTMRQLEVGKPEEFPITPPTESLVLHIEWRGADGDWVTRAVELPVRMARPGETP